MIASIFNIPCCRHGLVIRPIWGLGIVIVAQFSLGCQQGQVVGLKYSYQGTCGSDTAQLSVTVRGADKVSQAILLKPVASDGQSVALRLPANVPSPASIVVESKNQQECTTARGKADNVDFSIKRDASNPAQDIPIELVCLATPDCASPDGGVPALDPAIRPSYLWGIRCASDEDDIGTGAAFDGSGNVYITGSFSKPAGGVRCQFDNTDTQNLFENTLSGGGSFIAKIGNDGKMAWVRSLGTVTGSTFDVKETRIAAGESGSVYVSGYAEAGATIEDGKGSRPPVAAPRFIAKYDSAGRLGWVVSATLTGPPHLLKTTSLKAVTLNGKSQVLLGGVCQNADFGADGGRCLSTSQFLLRIEDGAQPKVSAVNLFELNATPSGDPNMGVFDIGSDKDGRIIWVGGNTTNVKNAGIADTTPIKTYLVKGTTSGIWDGGFTLQNDQTEQLTPIDFDRPWPGDVIRYGVHSYIDRDGNAYVGSLLKATPSAWLKKFPLTDTVASWTSNVSAAADTFAFVGIAGDNQQNPTWAAHLRGNVSFGSAYVSVAGPATTTDYDIVIGRYGKDFVNGVAGNTFYWQTPVQISLGSKSPVGFDVHPGSNRIAILSRTMQSGIKVDSILLDKLPRPIATKMTKYDLVLLMFGPK